MKMDSHIFGGMGILNNSGIYRIINTLTGDIYVGSAARLLARKKTHFSKLRCQTHENKHLQNAWNKYGAESFDFDVIEYVADTSALLMREQHHIDLLKPRYNINLTVSSSPNAGGRLTEEHRRKISASRKGQKGRPITKEQLLKMRAGRGPESRAKLSAANKKYYAALSDEARLRRNAHKVGRVVSTETRKKISEKAKGRKQSAEAKEKKRIAALRQWAKRLSEES